MVRYKLVMFDMDGTLVDSFEFHAKVFQRFLSAYDVCLSLDEVGGLIGNTLKYILNKTLPSAMHDTALKKLGDFYLNEIDDLIADLKLIPDAVAALKGVRSLGLRTALVTNSKRELVTKILDQKGIRGLFDAVAPADNDSLDKSGRCQTVMEEFVVTGKDVLYVGDHRYDVELAQAMGLASCLVYNEFSWLYPDIGALNDLKPDYIILDIAKLPELLN